MITNGRLLMVTTASVLLFVVLPYWLYADAQRRTDQAEREAAASAAASSMTQYAQELSDYQRCQDRVKSGSELRGALLAGVEHAEQTESLFVLMVTLLARDGDPPTPSESEFSRGVTRYQESIDRFRVSAENYETVAADECPSLPPLPAVLTHD